VLQFPADAVNLRKVFDFYNDVRQKNLQAPFRLHPRKCARSS
jgi:hypothetical protein